MTQPLRIIFAGTPDFAARHLQALIDSEHQIVGVYSQPDRPAGRGKKLKASEVKELALQHGLPVFQPASLKSDDALSELSSLNADIMIVVAYGLLLPKAILEAPRLGCLNVHGSILPRWRGAAPIQRAIWAGDEETGVTIMQMDEGLDTGDMLHISRCPIDAAETSASLYTKLADLGPAALIDTIAKLANGEITPQVQDDQQANSQKSYLKKKRILIGLWMPCRLSVISAHLTLGLCVLHKWATTPLKSIKQMWLNNKVMPVLCYKAINTGL